LNSIICVYNIITTYDGKFPSQINVIFVDYPRGILKSIETIFQKKHISEKNFIFQYTAGIMRDYDVRC